MKKIITIAILSSILAPGAVFALIPQIENAPTQNTRGVERKTEKRELRSINASTTRMRMASSTNEVGFCSQIDKAIVYLDTKVTNPGQRRSENKEKLETKKTEVRSLIDTRREENDTKRKVQLGELEKRATTPEQKQALATFTTVIEKALADKKKATDAVIEANRKEVDQAAVERKKVFDAALTKLTSDIESAKKKAVEDCKSGVQGEEVRTTLKNNIQTAKTTFNQTVTSSQKERRTSQLEKRQQTLKEIEIAYKKTVQEAKENLKKSFKATSTASSTSH
jgi:hypothetical protein